MSPLMKVVLCLFCGFLFYIYIYIIFFLPISVSVPKEEEGKEDQQLEREKSMIEADARLRRVFRTSEEEEIPFPTLVKTDKKKQKVVLDLQEAIREVKVSM